MKTEDTVEYNSLRWVKKELDLILQEAQASLSAYIEDTDDTARLRESVEHLHMVQGTLQMVELYGAAQLAEEMEKVSEALLEGRIEKLDDAYDVLMRSMLQLPDYLESLQSGSKDVPMVLLPLLNDLRASRNASLLSENVLFFPDVETSATEETDSVVAGELLAAAKKLRPHYQIGLLGWFKGEKVNASLKRIIAVLAELEKKSPHAATRRIWSITSALVDGLSTNGIDSNVSIKTLLGQVDRCIKQLIDSGEENFAQSVPAELLKNLLYYIARIKSESPRVKNIKATYRLEELLPADNDLEEARSGMGGLNSELLSTVSAGIREDLLEVKDALEIFVHSDVQDVARLQSLPDLLSKIADTLSMLGLGMPREQVIEQQKIVSAIIAGEHDSSDEVIMDMAGVLLSVESQLNSFIANRSMVGADASDKSHLGDFAAMPESEYLEVLSAVIKEALQDFSDARQAILGYLENSEDKSLLELVIQRLDEVNGAMFMLPVQKLKHEIDAVRDYVSKVMLNAGVAPEAEAQNDLADVVTSVEYYLESVIEGRPDIEISMSAGDAAADRLNKRTNEQGVDSAQEVAADIEAVQVTADDQLETETEAEIDVEETAAAASVEDETATPAPAGEEQRYTIISDDADEEILEIFIEEALEVLATLNDQVPLWSRDHANEDALITVRRSFHTLKGSGRLIGAELIGEFAWNFENMLNRVIDKSRPLTQEVFDVLDEALAVLPQLIEQLNGNKEPIPHIYELIDKADALGKWKKADTEKTAEVSPRAEAASEKVQEESSEEKLETEPVADADDQGTDERGQDEIIDNPDEAIELDEPVSELNESIELSPEEIQSEVEFELDDEISLHIDQPDEPTTEDISLEIESEIKPEPEPAFDLSSDDEMPEFSEDELLLEVEEQDVEPLATDELADDVEDGFDIDLTDELEALQVATSDDISGENDTDELVLSIDENVVDEPEIETEDSASILELDSDEDSEQAKIYVDPVLFDIFNKESENHLQQIRELLNKHYEGEAALTANATLLRALHTLYGSAKTAEVEEIAELSGGLDKYVKLYTVRNDLSLSDTGVQLVDDVCSKISEMLTALVDRSAKLQSDTALLARIETQLEEVQAENAAAASTATAVEEASVEDSTVLSAPQEAHQEDELISYYEVDDELVDIFLEEAEELLDSCENSLQRWNTDINDEESVQDLQRHLHTLKGGARMADLSPVGNLTHALESLVIAVNDGHVSLTKDMSNALHDSLDQLSDMLAKVKNREPMSSAESMISHIDALREGKETTSPSTPASTDEDEDPEPALAESDEDLFEIELSEEEALTEDFGFDIPDDVESDEDTLDLDANESDESILLDAADYAVELDAESLAEELSDGEHVSVSLIEDSEEPADTLLPSAEERVVHEEADPSQEGDASSLKLEKVSVQTEQTTAAKDPMANEQVRVRSDLLNDLVNHAGEVSVYHARMGQQISNFSFNISEMEQTVVRLREQLRQLSIETEAQILSRYEKETDQYGQDFDPLEMDRFSTMQQISRSLQETVGDIESIKDILSEEVRDSETLLLQESRVSTELQEGLMRTRMVHFGGLASRLRRIVRQTARELGKDVELDIIGETAEVDRTVLDRIVAPLEHMLRNAVSHGIETPEARSSVGKTDTGHLNITVDREGGDVVIIVKDDGRGIDAAAIRDKAMEKGMIKEGDTLTDHEVLQYIMQPGFSTAEKVTQISGRGVGMDVVDSEIKQLGGVLEIDTVKGMGTTFTVRLPLTLAINHALLVSVGEDLYAVPLNSIEGVVRLSGPELQQFYDSGENSYQFAGSEYQLKHLGKLLSGQQPDYSRSGQLFPVLLARAGDQSVALHVDELIGRREIVVKPVGVQLNTVRAISGATILGDGRVVLILEMNALVFGDARFHVSEADDAASLAGEVIEAVEEEREKIVMVVDDSITIRKVTERMLSRHNMKVVTAKDGVDAVAQLQEIKPDVMLLDIEMPRMDGYEVATHVRNDERLKDLPIIMITSRSGSKHRDKAMEIGVNKYLGKPYQEDDLMANIHELIG